MVKIFILKRENGFVVIDVIMYFVLSLCFLVCDREFVSSIKNVILGVVFDNSFEYKIGSCEFDIEFKNYNILIFDRIKYEVDGKVVFEDCYVFQVWYRYFYNFLEGIFFKVMYYFEVEKVLLKFFVVIECVENFDRIFVNG